MREAFLIMLAMTPVALGGMVFDGQDYRTDSRAECQVEVRANSTGPCFEGSRQWDPACLCEPEGLAE